MKITRTYKFFDTLLITLLVLSGGGLLFVYFKKPASVALCILSLFICIFFGRKLNKGLFNTGILSLVTFSSIILFTYAVSPFNQEFIKYVFYLLNGLSCVLIYIHISNNRNLTYFYERMRVVLRIILYFSLANFLFGFFLGYGFLKALPWWNGEYHEVQHFNYLFFYESIKHKYTVFGLDFVRNQGWFWEPGVNQVYLNLLLYLEGFVFKNRVRWIIPIIVFAIITTFSTSGLIIMSLLLLSMYVNSIIKYIVKGNPVIIILFSLFFILPSYYIVQKVVVPNIVDKTTGDQESSFQKRVFDLVQCPCIAADYPLTGVGLDKIAFSEFRAEYIMSDNCKALSNYLEELTGFEFKATQSNKGSSNSITGLMAKIGFIFSFILIFFFFRQNLFYIRKGIFTLVILVSVSFEPLLLRPFFLILIISGMFSFFNKFTK